MGTSAATTELTEWDGSGGEKTTELILRRAQDDSRGKADRRAEVDGHHGKRHRREGPRRLPLIRRLPGRNGGYCLNSGAPGEVAGQEIGEQRDEDQKTGGVKAPVVMDRLVG